MVSEFEVKINIDGMEDIKKAFENYLKLLPVDQVESELLDGAKVMYSAVKANTPRGETGNLLKGIKVKHLDRLGNDKPRSAIVASYAPHDHLVEFGTKPRFTKAGKYTGIMPARSFFRETVDTYKDDVMRAMTNDFSAMLDRGLK